jgi:hypothetical protein
LELSMNVYEEMLRADTAELALADAQRKLARVLQLADAWEREFGGMKINADLCVATIRTSVRGMEFA